MSEITQPTETQPVVETQIQPQATQEAQPTVSARQELYEKYSRLYPEAETQTQTAQPAQAVETPAAPIAAPVSPDVLQTIQSLKEEISGLKSQLTPTVNPTTPPAATEPEQPAWVEKLREGDFKGFEKALAEAVKGATVEETAQRAYLEAIEGIRVHNEIEGFLKDLRTSNPDIVPMEGYIAPIVQSQIETAKANGTIKSPAEFVTAYKQAVNSEVDKIRKIVGQYRAAGKNEAMTTKREVLSASTLSPQQIVQREQSGNEEPQVETPQDYLAKRLAQSANLRGLSV